jgi:hypothetical protein
MSRNQRIASCKSAVLCVVQPLEAPWYNSKRLDDIETGDTKRV